MARQQFNTVDVVRLEVETDPTGLVNLVQNPSGELGGWGWITTIVGSKIDGGSALTYTGIAGASWFTTEEMPVAAGQYAAARWNATGGAPLSWFRARFEWINSAGGLISSSTQTGFLATNSGVGNLAAQLAPAGTVWARLRFDVYGTSGGANPVGAHTFAFKEVTVAKSPTSGALGASRINLVPNPGLATDSTGWVAGAGTVARTNTSDPMGAGSLRHTADGTSLAGPQTLDGQHGMPVTGGQAYALRWQAQASTTPRTVTLTVDWYNSAGITVSTSAAGSIASVVGSWTSTTATVTAPAAAMFARLRITYVYAGSAPAAGEIHYFDSFLMEVGTTPGTYFDSTTPDAGGWDYSAAAWPPVATLRTNLVPNPSFEVDTAGWKGDNATISRTTSIGFSGSACARVTYAGGPGGSGCGIVTENASGTTDFYPVTPGLAYHVSAYVRAETVARKAYIVLYWYNGTTFLSGAAGPKIDDSAAWTRRDAGGVAPASATHARVAVQVDGSLPGEYHDVDAFLFEQSAILDTYFDGSTGSAGDFTVASGRAWNGTANNSTSKQTDTFTLPYSTAVNSTLGYLDPVQYLNVLGESHELREVRQALQVGELTATIVSRALDPADSALIRPGRRARLRALVNGGWDELITGKLLKANVDYELKDPSIPDEKRATITVNLIDAGQPLSQAKRPQGVATIAELPFVLEGAGVPWNVNGSGNQVATATPTTFNDNASALNQVALTRDTRSGYAWVSRRGVVNAWDAASLPSGSPLVLDEATYSGLKVTYDTDDCINVVSVTVQALGVDGTTTETTYGPYEDAASIEKNGRFLKEFTVTGLTKPQVDTFAAAVIAANKEPARRVQSVTLPLNTLARVNAHALIDLYDEVQVVNGEVSLSDVLRVTGIEHSIQTKKWLLTLTFATDGAVASPLFQPPVQSGASPDVGVIELFAGPVAKIPSTKLLCDGSSKAVASYPYLFAVIGYTFGGSGAFFNVPNLVDRFPIGAGVKALGTTGGSPTVTHNHSKGAELTNVAPVAGQYVVSKGNFVGDATISILPPWLALTPVIRAV